MSATVIGVLDLKKSDYVEVVEFDPRPAPRAEASEVARLELKYAGQDGIEVKVIHGASVAGIKETFPGLAKAAIRKTVSLTRPT